MNTPSIQFNRQKVAALLLAGFILAAIAGLAWAGADTSGSTFQPTQMEQSWSQLSSVKGRKLGVGASDPRRTDSVAYESGLLPWAQLRAVKAGKVHTSSDGFD